MFTELKKVMDHFDNNHCLSCGTTKNMRNRRYCSVKCRQDLRQKLNVKNGLLQAINTRFATFYFSEDQIILDVVPYGVKKIFRYSVERTHGHAPAYDFNRLTNYMGSIWWKVSQETNRKYLASQYILKMAVQLPLDEQNLRPSLIRIPVIKTESLRYLRLDKVALHTHNLHNLQWIIKNAYRSQVKIHHPDAGGRASNFRKIHDAYKDLLRWVADPSFVRRRGFPNKWYYSGENKKWVQPTPRPGVQGTL